jgi:hypothetical protein
VAKRAAAERDSDVQNATTRKKKTNGNKKRKENQPYNADLSF